MATATWNETRLGNPYGGGIVAVVAQATLTAADPDSAAWENRIAGDMCVQVAGTFGGATVLVQGSNDGTNYATLNDPQGNALSIATTAKIEQLLEAPRFLKLSSSGGGGTTDLDVTIFARRAAR